MNTFNSDLDQRTLMIVDNDEDTSLLLEAIFQEEGMRVITAVNGQAALDMLGTEKAPQLILSDMNMPVMGGAELLGKLKSNLKTKDIPVILASALLDLPTISENLGASGYLKKPYDIESLISIVNHHIN